MIRTTSNVSACFKKPDLSILVIIDSFIEIQIIGEFYCYSYYLLFNQLYHHLVNMSKLFDTRLEPVHSDRQQPSLGLIPNHYGIFIGQVLADFGDECHLFRYLLWGVMLADQPIVENNVWPDTCL